MRFRTLLASEGRGCLALQAPPASITDRAGCHNPMDDPIPADVLHHLEKDPRPGLMGSAAWPRKPAPKQYPTQEPGHGDKVSPLLCLPTALIRIPVYFVLGPIQALSHDVSRSDW